MMNNPYRINTQTPYGYPTYTQGVGSVPPVTPVNPMTQISPYMQNQVPSQMPSQMPGQVPSMPSGAVIPGTAPTTPPTTLPGQLPIEESYIENILRLNLGKMATIYMTFENNSQWNAKIFTGVVEAAGRDHIIISDPKTGMRYLLLMVNLDYITFDEELKYFYPYAPSTTATR